MTRADGVSRGSCRVAATAIDGRQQTFSLSATDRNDLSDNDGDGRADLADPDCFAPWQVGESPFGCVLDAELACLLPPLPWLRQRSPRLH